VSVRAVDFSGTDLAIRLYRRLIELQPMLPDNYSALMRILQLRGEVETAKKVAIELADRKTSSGEVQLMAASILDDNGFAADALHFFERSLQLAPDNYEAWMKYADALRASRTFDKSEAICRRMMEQGLHGKPYNQPRLFATLLRIARESGTLPQQLDYLDGLRDRDLPGKAEFFLSASKLFIQVKAEDRAEKFLVRFQEKMPTSPLIPDSYLLLGQLRFNRQDTAGAIAAFRSVVDKFPGTQAEITARFNIGEAYRQMGEPQDAVTAWLELANKRPDDDKALAGMYEAAVTAHRELKDNELSKRLFRLYTESGVQDFALLRRARANLQRLEMGQPLTDEESGS
jgi:tetratricopeptide (TPR) repeat protein